MIDREQSVLLVVDIQDRLFPTDSSVRERFLDNAAILIQAARLLHVPVLATVQNPEKLGATNACIAALLDGAPSIHKMEFGALSNAETQEALAATGRKQLLLIGMETHICVLQTALGAVEQGYSPYVVRDAVASRARDQHKAGIARMQRHGVGMLTVEMTIFEWLRIAGTDEFRSVLPLLK
jgi:nicotinamidase-related amidase